MSWLNNSLNSIKGQLSSLAQEVLAETAGPGDADYRGLPPEVDSRTALELLSDTQKEKEQLDQLCSEKESEITKLRKQITDLQSKVSDSGGGSSGQHGVNVASKSTADNAFEDSWCWEPDNAKQDNDRSSDTSSSGNGNEMVNITLEEAPLGAGARKSSQRTRRAATEEKTALQKRVLQLEEENKQLNVALEDLDMQHNVAMQNVLELKTNLQDKLTSVTRDYETLKKDHADKFINSELEMGKVRKSIELLEKEKKSAEEEKISMIEKIAKSDEELKRSTTEISELQNLLEKKSQDNVELIERVKAVEREAEQGEDTRVELLSKIEQLTKEMEELKTTKEKKTSESSTCSTGKQSEDEFILVREGDASSSGPTTPPTKEELKDKIVQLENRVSELTLDNSSFSLKLQDKQSEKELAVSVLKDTCQELQQKYDEQEIELNTTKEQLEEQREKIEGLREKAAEALIAQEKLKALTEEKLKIETEIEKMKENLGKVSELEKRLLLSEREKEQLQVELQMLRTAQERVQTLESEMQRMTMENQQFKLNAEAETETLNNSTGELEQKLKGLTIDNETLRSELEALQHTKFRQAIAEEKQEITDLDADDEEPLSMDKVRELINMYVKEEDEGESQLQGKEKIFKALRDRLWKVESLQKSLAQMSDEVLDLHDSKLVWDHEKKTLEADISQYIIQCDELMKNNEILLNELENFKRNKLETISEHNEENIIQLESELEECSKLNRTLEEEYAEVNDKIEELEREKQELSEQLRAAQNSNDELSTKEIDLTLQVETLKMEKCNLLFEFNELKECGQQDNKLTEELKEAEEKCNNLEQQLQSLSRDHGDLVAAMQAQKDAHQKAVETLNYEKNEMIKALQQKHVENTQYYAEIQRLSSLVQQLQQEVSAAATTAAAAAVIKPCEKCATNEATLAELKKDHEMQKDQINFLKEKSDILTTNLLTEQTNQKLVQQERMEADEQSAVVRKDIERLRAHLLEIEELHTQETIEMQRELDETKAKMIALEEEVSKSSTAYTSASIRANQHAETLQAQYALVVQQRDELVAKLSLAEDRESKNQAALCNLQCALEQFQNDKENDIKTATLRIRKELQEEVSKEEQLKRDIDALNQQLAEANQGLRAASRISDQLESCQQTIAVLREEVESLKQENAGLQEQLKTSESSQVDKIEKSLIKSLIIGYVVSGNPNDKNQVLRMISSVLGFTTGESDKVGLNKQQTSWLGSILGSGGGGGSGSGSATSGNYSRDNLVQAFVQFLEQESQPRANPNTMPNLLNITQSAPTQTSSTTTTATSAHAPPSRRTSTGSNNGAFGAPISTSTPTPIPIQPLLLNSNVLDEFAPSRNSSTILKDILNDS